MDERGPQKKVLAKYVTCLLMLDAHGVQWAEDDTGHCVESEIKLCQSASCTTPWLLYWAQHLQGIGAPILRDRDRR